MKKIGTTLVCTALVNFAQANPAPELEARDLDKNGITDAFYDRALNITWLRDAGAGGRVDWFTADRWVANLTFGNYSDWRLPILSMPDVTCSIQLPLAGGYPTQSYGFGCLGSEIGHLWYEVLRNSAGSTTSNTGDFQNWGNNYWFGTESIHTSGYAWYFGMSDGGVFGNYKANSMYTFAVRTGDEIPAVPEPRIYAMILVGIFALAILRGGRNKS